MMSTKITKTVWLWFFVSFVLFVSFVKARGADTDVGVDKIFSKWNSTSTPGCAVGAAVAGKPVLAKGYGMADLEHDVPITPDTIFEAGSVSKQFTAAAVLLLARDGKLSIDDSVRKYIPELPDYGVPLTIRHMLTHTSGLRDWGSVEAIAGWPRTSRAYTHAHVLDIVSRQKSLNFTPGSRWSYSNTGFNLAAIIVARVSGQSFPDFARERLFEPVGMTHTSWRDDFTRVLKNRAIAYSERDGVFHTDMPFENVYGNGGLLTTVGDLLHWNENFTAPKIADAAFETAQQQPARLTDGRPLGYAFGLFETTIDGVRIIEHSGSTAGYSAHLLRMPEQQVSVAVLCNATSARATEYAHEVADAYLPSHVDTSPHPALSLPPPESMAAIMATPAEIFAVSPAHREWIFRNRDNGLVMTAAPAGSEWQVMGSSLAVVSRYSVVEGFRPVEKATPTPDQLRSLVGVYTSDEAETTLTVALSNDALVIKRRPDSEFTLTPLYADAFSAPRLGTVIFRRDATGRVTALSVVDDRVWDLRFARR